MLVSCVCPTMPGRERFIPVMYKSFLSQIYPTTELIILTDGPVRHHAVQENAFVRYLTNGEIYKTLGAKRNAVNAFANGEIIVHFDDDDWSDPSRILQQVNFLKATGGQVVGYHDILYWRETDGHTFKYRYAGMGDYASGTSLCYYREYWRTHPFPELKVGEDASFVFRAKSLGVLHSEDSQGMIVAVSHQGSSAKPDLGSSQFPRVTDREFPKAFFEAMREHHSNSAAVR